MTTFRDILAHRGRIVLFTPSASVALPFELAAERIFATVICMRGQADPYIPISAWNRVHATRQHGLLSLSQMVHSRGILVPATDIVWVGPKDHHLEELYHRAMQRAGDDPDLRRWHIGRDDV